MSIFIFYNRNGSGWFTNDGNLSFTRSLSRLRSPSDSLALSSKCVVCLLLLLFCLSLASDCCLGWFPLSVRVFVWRCLFVLSGLSLCVCTLRYYILHSLFTNTLVRFPNVFVVVCASRRILLLTVVVIAALLLMCCAFLDLPNAPFRMVLGNVKLTGSRAVAQPSVWQQNQFEVSCGLVVTGGKYVCTSCEKTPKL